MGDDRHGRHGVTREPVDSPEPAEPEPELLVTPAMRLLATRNKLLRVKRGLEVLKALQRAGGRPEGEGRPMLPASHFVGVEIETDLERLADELEASLEELAALL